MGDSHYMASAASGQRTSQGGHIHRSVHFALNLVIPHPSAVRGVPFDASFDIFQAALLLLSAATVLAMPDAAGCWQPGRDKSRPG